MRGFNFKMTAFGKILCAGALSLALAGALAAAQPAAHPIPRLVQKDGRYALLVDNAPFLILGAQSNNSSAWSFTLPEVWRAIDELHANTLETPIYWEQFEPQPGHFDYSVLDDIVKQARQHHVHLVFLWFGTWKNGSQHYMPVWMKLHPQRYTHAVDADGRPVDSPSPFCKASLDADIHAFTALMRHLRQTDPQRTVIMVQVENETGLYGPALRDHSAEAQKLFNSAVPADVLNAMGKTDVSPGATWRQAFGDLADVDFGAWSIARYVQQVAAAGKAAYPLPLYVNAALRDPTKPEFPVTYESGGPTDNVIPIWKAIAPAIDLIAPDIYFSDSKRYLKVLDLYGRPGNALFVPETIGFGDAARFAFSVIGHGAIGYSPFGLDYTRAPFRLPGAASGSRPDFLFPTAQNYRLLEPMMRVIARLNFEGKVQAVAELRGQPKQTLDFGPWHVIVSYGAFRNRVAKGNRQPIGRALVAQLGPNEFLVTGLYSRVDFESADPSRHRQYLAVEQGSYRKGIFHFERILNGDQTDWGLNFGSEPLVLHVSVATY